MDLNCIWIRFGKNPIKHSFIHPNPPLMFSILGTPMTPAPVGPRFTATFFRPTDTRRTSFGTRTRFRSPWNVHHATTDGSRARSLTRANIPCCVCLCSGGIKMCRDVVSRVWRRRRRPSRTRTHLVDVGIFFAVSTCLSYTPYLSGSVSGRLFVGMGARRYVDIMDRCIYCVAAFHVLYRGYTSYQFVDRGFGSQLCTWIFCFSVSAFVLGIRIVACFSMQYEAQDAWHYISKHVTWGLDGEK